VCCYDGLLFKLFYFAVQLQKCSRYCLMQFVSLRFLCLSFYQVTDSVKQLKLKFEAKLKECQANYEVKIQQILDQREQDVGQCNVNFLLDVIMENVIILASLLSS
jgi:hypothetical protein